jgi:phage regulator Rha-like protein
MQLVSMQQNATMSSREIAELIGKRHDHLMVDIQKMLIDLELDAPSFSGSYKTEQGNTYPLFNLPKRETIILVSGYNVTMRAKIIDRWQELESQQVKPLNLNDPATLRGLLLGYTEQVEQLTIERDTAIATKAHISDRKTATALNTASQAVKRANKLESEIGRCINHATILAVRNATGTEYAWQPLRKYCKAFDIDTNTVHDERYGKVKSYPARAWMAVHGVDINGLFGE